MSRMHFFADTACLPSLLEGTMLLCFGLAWPLNTLGMLRRRRAEGKNLVFTGVILVGYVCGALAKWVLAMAHEEPLAPVFWLYVTNAATVTLNGAVYLYYRREARPEAPRAA